MSLFSLVFLATLSLSGCKDPGEKPDTSADSDADTDADTDADSDADTDTDTDADTDADTDTDTNTEECWIDSPPGECYDCDLPTSAEEDSLKFLNQCSDVSYSYFDNAARIPASTWTPGTPLPTVP